MTQLRPAQADTDTKQNFMPSELSTLNLHRVYTQNKTTQA